MSNLVIEHRETEFSRRLRRNRIQIAVVIAAVEAILVLVGIALLRDDGPLVCWPPPRASDGRLGRSGCLPPTQAMIR